MTNITDFDPATGETTTTVVTTHSRGAMDVAEADGQAHDTWHRYEGDGGGGTAPAGGQRTGNMVSDYNDYWYVETAPEDLTIPVDEPPDFQPNVRVTLDGIDLGLFHQVGPAGRTYSPGLCDINDPVTGPFPDVYFNYSNLDGVDHSALVKPLNDQMVTISWEYTPGEVHGTPTLDSVEPSTVLAGSDLLLTLHGSGFAPNARIKISHESGAYDPLLPAYVDDHTLTVVYSADQYATIDFQVANGMDGELSAKVPVEFVAPVTPTVTAITPHPLPVEQGGHYDYVITGSGFIAGCTLRWDVTSDGVYNTGVPTTVTDTELTGTAFARSAAAVGTLKVLNGDLASNALPVEWA